jgi:hypothetical protein
VRREGDWNIITVCFTANLLGRLKYAGRRCKQFPALFGMKQISRENIMLAHRVETTLQQDGKLLLDNLPFHAGEAVEIIILAVQRQAQPTPRYPLRGTAVHYDRPFEPVAQDDWDAA